MKTRKLLTGVATAALLLSLPMAAGPANLPFAATAAQAQDVRVSFNLFFDELEPHGVWVRHARYRYVWCPDVDVRWRPYTNGRWVYMKDYGWYFKSREPFAWAVYHYGRWFRDDRLGWCWVPGRNWAPAWVSWRHGGKVVGWAPLPPEEDGFQIRVSINIRAEDYDHDDWFFVPTRSFLEPDLRVRIRFGSARPRLVEETEYLGPVIIQNNIVINNVINVNFIEAETDQEVTVVEAAVVDNPAATTEEDGDDTVAVFAPQLEEPAEEAAPEQAVEPEQAEAELPQAGEDLDQVDAEADAEAEAADETDIEAELEAEPEVELEAPAEGETEAGVEAGTEDQAAPAEGDDGAAVAECPEGQELVEGVCVPIEAEAGVETETEAGAGVEAGAEETAPADEAAPTEETAPTDEAAPAEGDDGAAVVECPEGQELIDGVCVPIEQPATEPAAPVEESAPAEETAPTEEAAPVEEAAPEAAPAEEAVPEEEAVPAEETATDELVCPEGFVPYQGECITIEQARELGIIE